LGSAWFFHNNFRGFDSSLTAGLLVSRWQHIDPELSQERSSRKFDFASKVVFWFESILDTKIKTVYPPKRYLFITETGDGRQVNA